MINFNLPILINNFRQHKKLKNKLLNIIDKQKADTLEQKDSYYTDSISRLDWNNKSNSDRKWVQLLAPHLVKHFEKKVKQLGLKEIQLLDIWFQQYFKGDTHGWHVHGHNFTGVYYLELKDGSPRTQIVEPLSLKIINIDAKEGDIVIFPSIYIHRAPIIKSNERKTIISFNFNCVNVDNKFLKVLKKI